MSRDAQIPMEELLAHREWVGRLARQLAGAGADDVVQETWFAALRSAPQPGRPTRAWLATVLHNAIRLRFREESRRSRREEAFQALAPSQVEGVDRVYERLELQRFLAEQVMALEEPLRAIVVLRYVEGLDASEIAERVGAPPGTVRWRLKTALDRLRVAMDGRCGGDRRAWLVLLAPVPPMAGPPGAASNLATKGVLAMAQSKLKVSLLALAVLAVLAVSGTLLWRDRAGPPSEAGLAGSARSGRQPPRVVCRAPIRQRSTAPRAAWRGSSRTTGGAALPARSSWPRLPRTVPLRAGVPRPRRRRLRRTRAPTVASGSGV
jgi:RNA polymerase sigma-70 factor (ECF subfamily)